jgi:hypothetical protein
MRIHQIPRLATVLTVTALLSAAPASRVLHAQTDVDCGCGSAGTGERAMVLQGGGWLVDLDGTVLAARAELPVGRSRRWLFVPGLTYAHGDLRSPTSTDALVPEALLHFQLARGRVRPYLGGGAGLAIFNLQDRTLDGVITAAAGLRADLTPRWGARLEADMRIFGNLRAGSVGWGLGVARRF